MTWSSTRWARPTVVAATSPVMTGHPCYEVVFCDGSTIVADAEHLWTTIPDRGGVNAPRQRHRPDAASAGTQARRTGSPEPSELTGLLGVAAITAVTVTTEEHQADASWLAARPTTPSRQRAPLNLPDGGPAYRPRIVLGCLARRRQQQPQRNDPLGRPSTPRPRPGLRVPGHETQGTPSPCREGADEAREAARNAALRALRHTHRVHVRPPPPLPRLPVHAGRLPCPTRGRGPRANRSILRMPRLRYAAAVEQHQPAVPAMPAGILAARRLLGAGAAEQQAHPQERICAAASTSVELCWPGCSTPAARCPQTGRCSSRRAAARLAHDVFELVCSLGYRAALREGATPALRRHGLRARNGRSPSPPTDQVLRQPDTSEALSERTDPPFPRARISSGASWTVREVGVRSGAVYPRGQPIRAVLWPVRPWCRPTTPAP